MGTQTLTLERERGTLTDEALADVERRLRLSDGLLASANRPRVALEATEATRVNVLLDRAAQYRRDAFSDLGALYRFLASQQQKAGA